MRDPVFIKMFSFLGDSSHSNNSSEVVEYLSLTRHTYSAVHLRVSERLFDGLPEDVLQAVLLTGMVAIAQQSVAVATAEGDVLIALSEAGMEINKIEDLNAFRNQVGPVCERFEESIGTDLMARARATVASN